MQLDTLTLTTLVSLASTVLADGYTPGEPWSTLTPSATLDCGISDYSSTFGIAVQAIKTVKKRDVVSQITDGQIQATAAATVNESVESTITITKSTTTTLSGTFSGFTTTLASTDATPTTTLSSTVTDSAATSTDGTTTGPLSSSTTASTCAATATLTPNANSCKNDGTLSLTLNDGVLTDGKGRIGSIVSNRQFQFDGPPPQAGAIYAAGWSITKDGNLALGEQDIFYQCLSGTFYNLYDQKVAEQCSSVYLQVVGLVDC